MAYGDVPTEAEAFEFFAAEAEAARAEKCGEGLRPVGGIAAAMAIAIAEKNGYQHLLPPDWSGTES